MSVNFLETECKEPARTEGVFGICDDQMGTRAYTSIVNSENWIAKVTNHTVFDISFTAIDNCIIVYKKTPKTRKALATGCCCFPIVCIWWS